MCAREGVRLALVVVDAATLVAEAQRVFVDNAPRGVRTVLDARDLLLQAWAGARAFSLAPAHEIPPYVPS